MECPSTIREVFVRVADGRGFWSYFLPVDVAMSTSTTFELFKRCGRSGRQSDR